VYTFEEVRKYLSPNMYSKSSETEGKFRIGGFKKVTRIRLDLKRDESTLEYGICVLVRNFINCTFKECCGN
jgi:hypothetical protein